MKKLIFYVIIQVGVLLALNACNSGRHSESKAESEVSDSDIDSVVAVSDDIDDTEEDIQDRNVAVQILDVHYIVEDKRSEKRTVMATDSYKLFCKEKESDEPRYENYGEAKKIKRYVNIKYPTEIAAFLTPRSEYYDLVGLALSCICHIAFPDLKMHYEEDYSAGRIDMVATAQKWLDEVNTIENPDLDQGVAIMPWSSNDKFVQFRIDRHTYDGGNSDFPEVEFVSVYRNGHVMELNYASNLFPFFNVDFKKTVYDCLNRHLEELGEPPFTPDYRLGFQEEHSVKLSFEPTGVTFWFPKGSVASQVRGIVSVNIPYEVLRPYMKRNEEDRIYRFLTGVKDWHTFETLSTYP